MFGSCCLLLSVGENTSRVSVSVTFGGTVTGCGSEASTGLCGRICGHGVRRTCHMLDSAGQLGPRCSGRFSTCHGSGVVGCRFLSIGARGSVTVVRKRVRGTGSGTDRSGEGNGIRGVVLITLLSMMLTTVVFMLLRFNSRDSHCLTGSRPSTPLVVPSRSFSDVNNSFSPGSSSSFVSGS